MRYMIEIEDNDLAWLAAQLGSKSISFRLNRYDDVGAAHCRRLRSWQLIEQMPYHGELICYHPDYCLTDLGLRVLKQWNSHDDAQNAADPNHKGNEGSLPA